MAWNAKRMARACAPWIASLVGIGRARSMSRHMGSLLLAVIGLALGPVVHAAPAVFTNLSLTPSSGSVDAGKTIPVSFDYDVVWDQEGSCGVSIYSVELIKGSDSLGANPYDPHHGCGSQTEWLDEKREGPITVNLGAGTHVLKLRAWGNKGPSPVSGDSETRTIVITSKDNAQRVSESVPLQMVTGVQYDVSVTLKNTGTNTWAANSIYKLGSQNPADNQFWGVSRVTIDSPVAPGAQKIITFKVTAPATASSYNFQWRMLRDDAWFGDLSANKVVQVLPPVPSLSVSRDPNPMVGGEEYKLIWTSTNATEVKYDCTSTSGGYVGSQTMPTVSGNQTRVADAAWIGKPSSCTWTATGAGGTKTITETMTTAASSYNAAFVSQNVPAKMAAGQSYTASVTFKNTGTGTWPAGSAFQLGSQNPTDNTIWGTSRVNVDSAVPPNGLATFSYSIKAPATLGTANFQWKMVKAPNTWFGAASTNQSLTIVGADTLIPVTITPPHLTNADAGTLPGELGVSSAGAATYSIPIEVPPGTAGLKPNLSIGYSSQAGNGPLGLGWSLSGLSSIHRCGQTIAQDGVNGRIRFDTGDRLCLDGQRLVLVNKDPTDVNYWSSGAEYRTEIDQVSRITALGAGATLRFKVETKGRVIWYGGNAAGANTSSNVKAIVTAMNVGTPNVQLPYDKGGALAWAVDRITDRAGNFISFTYEQDSTTGEHKPVTIRYGGVGLKSHAAVQFVWETRPDAWKRYVDDARNDLRSRVSHIKTYYGSNLDGDVGASGTLVRDYAFTYEQSPTSGRSTLTTAQVCARNPKSGTTDCLPASTFAWGQPDKSKKADWVYRGGWAGGPLLTTINTVEGAPVWAMHPEYFAFADFENHGYLDVLEKRVSSPLPVGTPGTEGYKKDANALGYNVFRGQYRYFHNNGSSFTEYKYKISTGQNFVVLATGDFNGDGAPDLLVDIKLTEGSTQKICLSPLAKLGPQGAPGSMITFNCNSGLAAIGKNVDYQTPHVLDVLGDGRSALYSRYDDTLGFAKLCIQDSCVDDRGAPFNYLGYTNAHCCSPLAPLASYVAFNEMFDFAGTGKQQDARLTLPHFVKKWCDDGGSTCFTVNTWQNPTPTVFMTGFRKPESADSIYNAGSIQSYLYTEYHPKVCNENDCTGVLPPYTFDVGRNATGDFNGTGYSNPLFGFVEFGWGPAPNYTKSYSRAELTTCLSTGRRLDCGVRKKYSGDTYVAPGTVGNFVGDGQPSFVGTPTKIVNGLEVYGDTQMCRIRGDDTTAGVGTDDTNIVCEPWATLPIGLNSVSFEMDLLGTGRTQVMVYRPGYYDTNFEWKEVGRWDVYEPRDVAYDKQALDRIHQVTNGVGAVSKVEYVDGVPSSTVTRSGTSTLSYPQQVSAGVGKIVRRLVHDNGVAADRSTLYAYEDAGTDVAGRGSLGFAKVTTTDEQTGLVTTTTYSQQWPMVGMELTSTVTKPGNAKALSETTNRLLNKIIVQANKAKTYCPLSAGSTVVRYDSDYYLGTVTTTGASGPDIEYGRWCNLLNSKTVSEGSAVDSSATFTTTTVNTYVAADFDHWLMDLLSTTTVTKEQSGDPRKISRDKTYLYEENFTGRVAVEKIQNDDALRLTIEYDRSGNPFGLVNKRTERWQDPVGPIKANRFRETKTTYDPNGRLPITLTNALDQSETNDYNYGSGAPISRIDRNQLPTKWTVDGFGRVLVELRPDGNETRSYIKRCDASQSDSACPKDSTVAKVSEAFHGSDRITVPQVSHLDSAGHALHSQTWGFDGVEVHVDQRFDSLGRLFETDQPRYKGAKAYLASRQLYDELNRVTSITTLDEKGVEQTLTNDYQGMVTVITNPKQQVRKDKRDVLGQVRLVVDNLMGETKFGYDAWGDLTQTIDPNGNVINVKFDDLGRRTELNDSDLGLITYLVDPLGRTRQQTGPKQRVAGKTTLMDFDRLDRMHVRVEQDLESRWEYDTATKGVGQLGEAYTIDGNNVKDYRRIHTYDSVGRPSTTTQVLTDGNYTSTPSYDGWGRPYKQTYQRGSDATKEFTLRYNTFGYQSSVERPGLVLSQVITQDAANRVTKTSLGNGLTDSNTFSPYTGRMQAGMVKTGANAVRLQEGYEYDPLGNVIKRTQLWDTAGFIEDFTYDDLNRLWTSQVQNQPQKTFIYDAAGNLKTKTGAGTYTYPVQGPTAIRPHAVKNVSAWTEDFNYDDNGNLLRGAGRDWTWTSFDMPVKITKGTFSSTFAYGPEHQRAKQIRGDGQVTIYAGAQEVETKSGVTTVKTYWPNGVGLEIDKTGQTGSQLMWTHADRLGSPVSITDSAGSIAEKLEYDAWGKRRSATDDNSTPDSLDGVIDNKGFTRHEMLDQLDLVHMNGRVYDPFTGRFVSGDPLVQEPVNGQSYNRYSYVLNNPTNLTDPTGFATMDATPRVKAGIQSRAEKRVEEATADFNARGVGEQTALLSIYPDLASADGIKIKEGVIRPDAKGTSAAPAATSAGGGAVQGAEGSGLRLPNLRNAQSTIAVNRTLGEIEDAQHASGAFALGFVPGSGIVDGAERIKGAQGTSDVLLGIGMIAMELPGLKQGKGAKGAFELALGLSRHPDHGSVGLLGRFAEHVNAKTYWDLYANTGDMRQMAVNLLNGMKDAKHIHFNLDGMLRSGTTLKDLRRWGSEGIGQGNVTNWELHQILSNPAFSGKSTFYLNGKPVNIGGL